MTRVRGKDSNALLEDVFGETARPEPEHQQLEEIAERIDAGDLQHAKELLAELTETLGGDDRDVVRAEWALRDKEDELRVEDLEKR